MIAWFKTQWAKRPWLLGIIAGGLVAAGYWVYTKAAASGGSSTADSSLGTPVSLGSSGSGGAGDSVGADTTGSTGIAGVVSSLADAMSQSQQNLSDAFQQSQQQNTDLLTQEITAGDTASKQLFSAMQQQFDNLAAMSRATPSISQQLGPVQATVVQPVVPLVVAQPVVTPAFVQPVLPQIYDQQPQLSIPVAAAPAIENITKALNGGLLSTAAAKNMVDAVNATPVPAGTPTGSAIKVPAGSIPYPTGVSVAQGLAMALAFASTPLAPVIKAVSAPVYTPPAPVYKAPVVKAPPAPKPAPAPVKKIVGHTIVSA